MSGKKLITESDVRAMGQGGVLRLDAATIATPSALDAAFALGIRVLHGEGGSCASKRGAKEGECKWHAMLATDGTYIVEIKGGRAVISRLTPEGPVSFGTDTIENHQ